MAEHDVTVPSHVQQEVFDVMRERLGELFGPGGSFRITLGRPTSEDAVFVDTVAETIAWQVAAALSPATEGRSQHAAEDGGRRDEAEELWAHVERELLRRRTAEPSATEETVPVAAAPRAA